MPENFNKWVKFRKELNGKQVSGFGFVAIFHGFFIVAYTVFN